MRAYVRQTGFGILQLTALTCARLAQHPQFDQPPYRLRVDADHVEVYATVTDCQSDFITGLERENFKIFEDKVPQEIAYLSSEDVPVTVGIIFDVSGSMKDKLPTAVRAAITFMKNGNRDDKYFLLEFSDRPIETADLTSDIAKIQGRLLFSKAKGKTALYDAVYDGLRKLDEGSHARRALLLITDGEDNSSRHTFSNVKEFVRERDIPLYAIGLSNGWVDMSVEEGRALLRKLSALSGGNSFFPPDVSGLENICRLIALELKHQYVIGYYSTNTNKDGTWRKIKVSAEYQKEKLTVRAKAGYYADPVDAPRDFPRPALPR